MMYAQVIGGMIVLLVGGDILVRGSVSLSRRFGLSPLVIGLTVVALGTSMPELVVVLDAALKDAALDQAAEISIGNVVGSNIANVLLVLGIPALIRPIACDAKGLRTDTTIMIAASIVFAIICVGGVVERWHGIVMVAALAAYIAWCYRAALGGREADDHYAEEVEEYENARRPPTSGGFAKLPGDVPPALLEGLFPSAGSENFEPMSVVSGIVVEEVLLDRVVEIVMKWAFPTRVSDRRA